MLGLALQTLADWLYVCIYARARELQATVITTGTLADWLYVFMYLCMYVCVNKWCIRQKHCSRITFHFNNNNVMCLMFRLTCQADAGEVTDPSEVEGGDGAFYATWRWKASTTKQNK